MPKNDSSDASEVLPPASPEQERAELTGMLAAQRRKEAMDSALDVVATTTKLEAKEAHKKALKAVEKAREDRDKAGAAYRDLRSEVALKKICEHPAIPLMMQLVDVMSDGQVSVEDPLELLENDSFYEGHDIKIKELDNDDQEVLIQSQVSMRFQVDRELNASEAGHTIAQEKVCVDTITAKFRISEFPEMVALKQEWERLDKELEQASAHASLCKDRLDNHADQVDVARVNLQRNNLATMGAEGATVLQKVDDLLESTKEGNYLELL